MIQRPLISFWRVGLFLQETGIVVICFLLIAVCFSFENETRESGANIDLAGIKCVVTGKPVSPKHSCQYRKGLVFFDCQTSRIRFQRNPRLFATKANHQLVVTSQYVQTSCPISSDIVTNESDWIRLAGVRLRICCPGCSHTLSSKGSVQQQIEFLFGDRTFEMTFSPVEIQVSESGKNEIR